MAQHIRVTEYANGIAYTTGDITLAFPFGSTQRLIWHGEYVLIERPERFGKWGTAAEKRAYTLAYAAGKES